VHTPCGEVIKISSSSDLSTFCLGTDPQHAKGVEATLVGSSSVSIGELWPNIDKLDEISRGGGSVVTIPEVMPRGGKSQASVEKSDEYARHKNERALPGDAPGPSVVLPKSRR
jgi:hypothetical protein